MKFITSLHAYDCLSDVVYAVTVRQYSDYEKGESEVTLDLRGSFPGQGLDEAARWLELILEELKKSL